VKPSLDNAYARVRRAEHHLSKLKSESPGILSVVSGWAEGQQDLAVLNLPIEKGITSLPPSFGIRVGEAIYNLRAALDYLVYELAILDSGIVQHGTQFPIEDSKSGWQRKRPQYLVGISAKHQGAIELLQPYKGCNWTKTLRGLSNPDKHKTLTIIRLGPLITNTNVFSGSGIVTAPPMKVYRQFSFDIVFDDGSRVIETLQELQSNIASVLDGFNPEF
jgi:hypothetical protein